MLSERTKNTAADHASFRVFAHLNADKQPLYRAILQLFSTAREQFTLHLRPSEVLTGLRGSPIADDCPGEESVELALRQLTEWGNLTANRDTSEVATVEEFYRPRYLYQFTAAGEAAETAIQHYLAHVDQAGELQSAALKDVFELLEELLLSLRQTEPDPGKVLLCLNSLADRFNQLTSRAQTFMRSLQRTIDLHGISEEVFLSYKESLIDYLERFIGELVMATSRIAAKIDDVERIDVHRALAIAARRELVDAVDAGQDDLELVKQNWEKRWQGLRHWFIGQTDKVSQAEILRSRARSAIPALLNAISHLNDRRVTRTDRAQDLQTLARWFAQSPTESDAHRLWRSAFCLGPSRHLSINQETLDERDTTPVPPGIGWLNAPPMWITPRLRKTGRHAARGPAKYVIDRSLEKQLLAAHAAGENLQIAEARNRLANGRTLRLSNLEPLNPVEFELFLDLLGEALARKIDPNETVETVSTDGALSIRLSPTEDDRIAEIVTPHGRFRGADHFITITRLFPAAEASHTQATASIQQVSP